MTDNYEAQAYINDMATKAWLRAQRHHKIMTKYDCEVDLLEREAGPLHAQLVNQRRDDMLGADACSGTHPMDGVQAAECGWVTKV